MKSVEENYFIDVDLSDEKNSIVMIYKQTGSTVKMVNSFAGKNAVKFYDLLSGELKMEDLMK